MKNFIRILFAVVIVTLTSCKKDSADPNDNNPSVLLQGKWRATQQSATVNGQQAGETQYFNGDEAIFEFAATELLTYNGDDKTTSTRKYTWRIVNGELILREQYADSAQAYTITFEGNDIFLLRDSYTSTSGPTTITIRFARK